MCCAFRSTGTAHTGTPGTLPTANNFIVSLMQVETGHDKETGERQGKTSIICCQEKRLFSLPHFYFLHCWSTKWSLKGYLWGMRKGSLWSMQRLCVTSDGSSCWMIDGDCAKYLLLMFRVPSNTQNSHTAQLQEINLKAKHTHTPPPIKTYTQIYPISLPPLPITWHDSASQTSSGELDLLQCIPGVSTSVFQGHDLDNALPISFISRNGLEDHRWIKAISGVPLAWTRWGQNRRWTSYSIAGVDAGGSWLSWNGSLGQGCGESRTEAWIVLNQQKVMRHAEGAEGEESEGIQRQRLSKPLSPSQPHSAARCFLTNASWDNLCLLGVSEGASAIILRTDWESKTAIFFSSLSKHQMISCGFSPAKFCQI